MRCSQCDNDVPMTVVPTDDGRLCPDCDTLAKNAGRALPSLCDVSSALNAIPVDWDDWELEDDLQQAERWARGAIRLDALPTPKGTSTLAAHASQQAKQQDPARQELTFSLPPTSIFYAYAWVFIAVGLMAFLYGAALFGWAAVADRGELWRIGILISIVGQAGWLVGILLRLGRLERSQRAIANEIAELSKQRETHRRDDAMDDPAGAPVKTPMLNTDAMADPQQVLLDLKRQIDVLTRHYSRTRRAA